MRLSTVRRTTEDPAATPVNRASTGRRSGVRSLAVLAAAAAVTLTLASPAQADYVDCTRNPAADSGWTGDCHRYPVDDDAGGVSGIVFIDNVRADEYARIDFHAKGENFELKTYLDDATFWAYYYLDGQWYAFFEQVHLNEDETQFINKSLSENRRVRIMVCQEEGCAGLSTLRS